MSKLTTDFNLGAAGDDVYSMLIDAHDGLPDAASRKLDARLILLLANHIGDPVVIRDALARAKQGLGGEG